MNKYLVEVEITHVDTETLSIEADSLEEATNFVRCGGGKCINKETYKIAFKVLNAELID